MDTTGQKLMTPEEVGREMMAFAPTLRPVASAMFTAAQTIILTKLMTNVSNGLRNVTRACSSSRTTPAQQSPAPAATDTASTSQQGTTPAGSRDDEILRRLLAKLPFSLPLRSKQDVITAQHHLNADDRERVIGTMIEFLLAVADLNMKHISAKATTTSSKGGKRKPESRNGTVVNSMINALIGRFDLAPTSVLEYKGSSTTFKKNPHDIIGSDYQCNLNQVACTVLETFQRAYNEFFRTRANK